MPDGGMSRGGDGPINKVAIETRICKNCKWFVKDMLFGGYYCKRKSSIVEGITEEESQNFGCNQWEKNE